MGSRLGIEKIAAKRTGVSLTEWRRLRADGKHWCYLCEQWLPRDRFTVDKSRASGLKSVCRACQSHKATASRYQIPIAEARSLRTGDRCCDICGRTQKLEVDHNHSSGAVRGVLCSRCNGALGQFCDDIELLQKAIRYLETHNG